jgi:hypothetical protein
LHDFSVGDWTEYTNTGGTSKFRAAVQRRRPRYNVKLTYAICCVVVLGMTFLLVTKAGATNAEADATKSAETTAENFIFVRELFCVQEIMMHRRKSTSATTESETCGQDSTRKRFDGRW